MEDHQHPKTSVHAIVIALAILNAVGMLVLYFKIDLLSSEIRLNFGAVVDAFTPPPLGQTQANRPPTDRLVDADKKVAGFGEDVFLKPGEAFSLLGNHGEGPVYEAIGTVLLQTIVQNAKKQWVATIYVTDHDTGKSKQFELPTSEKMCADTPIGGLQLRAISKDQVVLFPQLGCE